MDRYYSNKTINPVEKQLRSDVELAKRSRFNRSCMRYYKGRVGAIMPIKMFECVPNSDLTIQVSHLVKLAVPMAMQFYGSFRIYTHVYAQEYHSMWEGSDVHYYNGRSGEENVSKPRLKVTQTFSKNGSDTVLRTNMMYSPADYLCLPFNYAYVDSNKRFISTEPSLQAGTSHLDTINPSWGNGVSALPFVMYHNICRDFYSNPNLLQQNKYLFPDNPEMMKLPYDASNQNVIYLYRSSESYDNNKRSISDYDFSYFNGVDSAKDPYTARLDTVLNVTRYRMWKGDYFTTCSKLENILRGNAPTINVGNAIGTIDWSDVFGVPVPPTGSGTLTYKTLTSSNSYDDKGSYIFGGTNYSNVDNSYALSALDRAKVNSIVEANIDLAQLRKLEALTIFKERMARTDGGYNQAIESQGLGNPKHEHCTPIYLGGSYQDFVFSDVTQSVGTDSAPLGSKTSQGLSSARGDVIKYHAKDFSLVMICVSIVPETVYSQGVERVWTKLNQDQEYFPILNNLSPQPVLNKEIYYSGTSSDSELFGWQERFSEYKAEFDKASGAFTLPDYEGRKAVNQRRFTSTPTLSASFMSLSTFDNTIFASSTEMPFDFVTSINCNAVMPMPYKSIPGGLQARG